MTVGDSLIGSDPTIVTAPHGDYTCTTDPACLDIAVVHRFLSEESYWAQGIALEKVERSIAHSLCFSIWHEPTREQIGFARIISDFTVFAWIADVFVLPAHRGLGLSKWLMSVILAHPDLQGLRRMLLATRDAHGLYGQYGFTPLAIPERYMERKQPPPGT